MESWSSEKWHFFWAPKHDEYSFTVDSKQVSLAKKRPAWQSKWAISEWTVSVDGEPLHAFTG